MADAVDKSTYCQAVGRLWEARRSDCRRLRFLWTSRGGMAFSVDQSPRYFSLAPASSTRHSSQPWCRSPNSSPGSRDPRAQFSR